MRGPLRPPKGQARKTASAISSKTIPYTHSILSAKSFHVYLSGLSGGGNETQIDVIDRTVREAQFWECACGQFCCLLLMSKHIENLCGALEVQVPFVALYRKRRDGRTECAQCLYQTERVGNLLGGNDVGAYGRFVSHKGMVEWCKDTKRGARIGRGCIERRENQAVGIGIEARSCCHGCGRCY